MQIITATVHTGLLDKADRLFRNDDYSVLSELIQNARRAGATQIDFTIEDTESEPESSAVTIHDNGGGIADFQTLLTLGESGWTGATQAREDPAGMGFFSLCRSEVEVHSGNHQVKLSPAVFAGKESATVEYSPDCVAGTRIRFTRASSKHALESALRRSAQFCPVDVTLGGSTLPQQDFLAGALYRENIDGIEVGFATAFENGYSHYTDENWNFYGLRLHHILPPIPGYIPPGTLAPSSLHIRCNVFDTARVRLQLPDRRALIEDEFFKEFEQKVRAAGYRFLQTQLHHALPFKHWKDAQELGVTLPEAAFLLTTWHAAPHDDGVEWLFGHPESMLLTDLTTVMLVPSDLEYAHTFEGALESGATLEAALYREDAAFVGYSWYDKLPRITDVALLVDGLTYEEWSKAVRERPERIEITIDISQSDLPTRELPLPGFLLVIPDEGLSFVAVANSPWDNERLDGPFSVADFLMMATFQPSDDWGEADSWQTQHDNYEEEVDRAVNEYFRGPRATLIAILRSAIEWQADRLATSLGITEIHFTRKSSSSWEVELMAAPPPHETQPS